MRSIWSGGISFGLIYIPVNLYSGSKEREIQFHYLDKKDHSRIRYAKYRESDGKEVEQEDIVRGFEYEKDKYVILEDEDFEKADVKKSNSIEIVQFCDEHEIDSVYFEKPYYLEPDEKAAKTYNLLVKAMEKAKLVAVASFVLKTKEHLAIVKPENGMLILNQMRFEQELNDTEELKIPDESVSKEELSTAVEIIKQMHKPFQPEKFKDTYTNDLKSIIKEKATKKKITTKGKAPQPTDIVDLMKQLKASLK